MALAATIYTNQRPANVSETHVHSQDSRALKVGSVRWSTMHSGAQLAYPREHREFAGSGTISDRCTPSTVDTRAQKDVIGLATSRRAFPPTPPSTASSSWSSASSEASRTRSACRKHVPGSMDPTLQRQDSAALLVCSSKHSSNDALVKRRPFQQRHGRRYTRDASYPLPCDVPELQRQNLRTSLACTVFGRPICSPEAWDCPPTQVLELGCGAAYWTTSCHAAYSTRGYDTIRFTGMDIVPVAPDLRQQGVNWRFMQHDMRSVPWPFEDGSFDFIMWKDLSLVVNAGAQSQKVLDECIRVLRAGGTLEIWEQDSLIRSMEPHSAPDLLYEEQIASRTATFSINAGTPFAPTGNKYLRSANKWIQAAIDKRGLDALPCTRMATLLLQEPESLVDLGVRRAAIPLSTFDPAKDARDIHRRENRQRAQSHVHDSTLSHDQVSLRQTALLTVVQLLDSLEPLLKDASGKNNEEWSFWWTCMLANLCNTEKKTLSGECLEIGAWWATKLDDGLR